MKNSQIARCLREVAAYLEMQDEPFKPRAYEKAAHSIEGLEEPLAEVYSRGGLRLWEGFRG